MTSKVLVKIPSVPPFSQVNNVKKPTASTSVELCGVGGGGGGGGAPDPALRVGQLEQNIRFLQEQHSLLLTGLHREIDLQRQMNRDLQFQLIFSKRKSSDTTEATTPRNDDSTVSPTTPVNRLPEVIDSPKSNEESERCTRLEQELVAAKAALQSSLAQTAELQTQLQQYKNEDVVEESALERFSEPRGGGGGGGGGGEERAQGERQRREVLLEPAVGERGVTNLLFEAAAPVARNYLQSIKASLNAAGRGNAGGGGGGARGGHRGQQRFPPLQPPQHQAYWQQRETQKIPNPLTEQRLPNRIVPSKSNVVAFGGTYREGVVKTTPKSSPRHNVKILSPSRESNQSVVSGSVLPKPLNIPAQVPARVLKLSSTSVPTVSMGKNDRQK